MKVVIYYRLGMTLCDLDYQKSRVATLNDVEIVKDFYEDSSDYKGNRPVLDQAIAYCQEMGTCLVFPEMGRLSANRRVLQALLNSGIEFLACENEFINRNTVHIHAALAEDGAKQISQTMRDVMTDLRKKGVKLGSANPKNKKVLHKAEGWKKAVKASVARRSERAIAHYAFIIPEIKRMRDNGGTLAEVTDWLNAQGHTMSSGYPFTQTSLFKIIKRYLGDEYLGKKRHGGRPKNVV